MHSTKRSLLPKQHGVYALEWAIVFPVFFIVLYAIVGYGLAFLVRESMQYAIEDGARAALRYQPSRELRLKTAQQVALEGLSWLPDALKPDLSEIQVQVCQLSSTSACAPDLVCGTDVSNRCIVTVQLAIPYGTMPLAPSLPGLGFLLPETIFASASVLVDRGGV